MTELRERLGGGGTGPKGPGSQLTQQDLDAIGSSTGAGSRDVTLALRADNVSAAQQVRIDNLNAALNKLPDNKGTVYRGTNLDTEDIAKYQEGGTVTEKAFTSTSTDPVAHSQGIHDSPFNPKPERMFPNIPPQQAGYIEDEVSFRSSTNFRIEETGQTQYRDYVHRSCRSPLMD
ncbi:ADP-ribosyltransferase [Nocardia salmonicida]|uniref:ADP-ribosyltransferase n=1 Tax=Nocardia salmonicida TaxID=53431 RepID=UPI0037BDCEC0